MNNGLSAGYDFVSGTAYAGYGKEFGNGYAASSGLSYGNGGLGFNVGASRTFMLGSSKPSNTGQQGELFPVDKELKDIGIDPMGDPKFEMEPINLIKNLPSINDLIDRINGNYKTELLPGNKDSYYRKGILYISEKDFSSFRVLATAFGHELVHRYNDYKLSPDLHRKGFITAQHPSFPHHYDEALAHYWSYNYSGLGGIRLRHHISMSNTYYKGIMKHFNHHKIDPK